MEEHKRLHGSDTDIEGPLRPPAKRLPALGLFGRIAILGTAGIHSHFLSYILVRTADGLDP